MKAFSDGKMQKLSTGVRANMIEADLEIWRRTKSVGELLIREL